MVSGSRIEGGNNTTHNLSAGVRKTIQSIKEIVGNHSDADIYATLKETNMDPNETTQKLLNQDPFHEVRRKRDKKKEVIPSKTPVPVKPIKPTEQPVQAMKSNTYLDRNPRRTNIVRNNAHDAGVTRQFRQFRVVRDNRINQYDNRVIKPSAKNSEVVSTKEPPISNVSAKSSVETSKNQKPMNLPVDSLSKQVKGVSLSGKRSTITPPVNATKTHDSVTSPNSSVAVVGVYSSSSDPVHIPSLASRPSANVGTIKREVGTVGVRRYTSENTAKMSSFQGAFVSKSELNVSESVPAAKLLNNINGNQHNSRPHQHPVNHQKGNKEWKPKSSKKPTSATGVGVIGSPKKPASTPANNNNSKELVTEGTNQLQDKLAPATTTTHEDQNVIIAAHIRVSETDRCCLTFGSLGIEVEVPQNSGYQEEASYIEESQSEPPLTSLSVSSPDSSCDEPSRSKQVEWVDEHIQSSGSISQESGTSSEQQQPSDRLESSSSPQNNEDDYTNNIGVVRHSSPSQHASELPSLSAYDSQTGYDISYFRPRTDESLRGQVLPIPQEAAFNSHLGNNIPASTIAMLQQQQQGQVAQMYPQIHHHHHLQHFIPYHHHRQFITPPPVYVPPMMMQQQPTYSSNNPSHHLHPTNASTYLVLPGAANSPHVNAKYAIPPQYKSLQAPTLNGFGNFTSPTGCTLNTPGVVDDPSRLKYKDAGNVYLPNPQGEASEHWMNPREMQSAASYYNMATGQTPPHAAYMAPSHTAHATSFNAAAQSSHMQFSGLYHPSQLTAHHMGPNMGGNVGVAPGTQVAGYHHQQQQQQQPQLSQLNWTGNF
ncbi:uncharacterized protein [Rutidosis leptorrhynchoides]|uniref:uncharacterized protein isoform X2 n=1 Tax=Rutidosis leptorrhynchoides TaxID=125765 RepID=UPI003A99DC77